MNKVLNNKPRPIVLVDQKDNIMGLGEKFSTHKNPVKLHRAISVLVFSNDRSKMLITKRSSSKPTWGGYWSNAVCSHPYPEESYQKAAERRLFEELGIKTKLKDLFNFTYKARMRKSTWGECELDHVFEGLFDGPIKPDPTEIDGYEWVGIKELKNDIKNSPGKYTPWFKKILNKLNV